MRRLVILAAVTLSAVVPATVRPAVAAQALPAAVRGRAAAVAIPAPSATRPLVILTVGDSITVGDSNAVPAADGYRTELDRLLTAAGVPHVFVVDAHGGWSCDALRSTAPAAVARYNPDFALLDCGTNDMPTADRGNAFADVYADLLNRMWWASPSGQLKILPSWITYSTNLNKSPNTGLQITEPVVNDAIYRVWKSAAQRVTGQLTTPVDFQGIPEMYLDAGGIHPTAAGYTVMGRQWYRMLRDSYYSDRGWPDPPVTCGLTGHRPDGYTQPYTPCTGLGTP